jgi:mycothiol maleylpyruvate isomerase-like protein
MLGNSADLKSAYLIAAASATDLIADPAVVSRWGDDSALVGMTVGGLAEHLANQIFVVSDASSQPAATHELIPLLEHYSRATWVGADHDADINVTIRNRGEQAATEGPDVLSTRLRDALTDLRARLVSTSDDHPVQPPAGPWSLRLTDFLITRMMEIVVHSDDLAHSVGVPTPPLPTSVTDPVLHLLLDCAVRRHGVTALVRALSRAERAPDSVAAF